MDADTEAERDTARRWWRTADSASAAAAQILVWIGLIGASVFAAMVEPGVGWWLGICAWTLGLIASTATVLLHCGLLSAVHRAPMTPAATFSRGLATAALGAVAVTALAVLVSTGSAAVLVLALLAAASAVWVYERGFHSARR